MVKRREAKGKWRESHLRVALCAHRSVSSEQALITRATARASPRLRESPRPWVKQAVERVAKGLALIIEAHIAALSRACEGSDINYEVCITVLLKASSQANISVTGESRISHDISQWHLTCCTSSSSFCTLFRKSAVSSGSSAAARGDGVGVGASSGSGSVSLTNGGGGCLKKKSGMNMKKILYDKKREKQSVLKTLLWNYNNSVG